LRGNRFSSSAGATASCAAFFNVCRHHAAAVVTKSEGKAENLRCPYHGWTYDLEGKLILAPEFADVANFERNTNGLMPFRLPNGEAGSSRNCRERTGAKEFSRHDLIERFERMKLEQLCWFERRSYFLHCNWKVFVDNYLDGGYHVPHIHGGLSSVLDNSKYKIETGERFCLQSSPSPREEVKRKQQLSEKAHALTYLWIYPNFMINIYDEVMDTNLVIPRGVDKTEVVFDYYFANVSTINTRREFGQHRRQRTDSVGRCRHLRIGAAWAEFSCLQFRASFGPTRSRRTSLPPANYADLITGLSYEKRTV
jgi:choline monooxygenase